MKPTTILTSILLFTAAAAPAPGQTLFSEGLQFPQRLIPTPLGNLLVSEGGAAAEANKGRVSLVNRQGERRSLLEGLPSAAGQGIPAFGPTGMGLDGRTLYLLIGEGNVMVGPPFVINTDGPSSPLFSSVLRIQFSTDVDGIRSGFEMSPADHWSLIDGNDIDLRNAGGDRAVVHLLTTFRLVRNILGGTARVRPSDPYGAWLHASDNTLYIADASAESLGKVNTVTGKYEIVTRFQPDERTTAAGTQFVDNVPTSLCPIGDSFLMSFLSAGPFPPGASSIRAWKPSDGSWSRVIPLISGLTMTNDMLCLRGGTASAPRVVTVEYTTTPPANFTTAGGRIQLFEGAQGRTLAQGLLLPTAVTQDPITGDLFVTTLPGAIYRVPLP